MIKGLRLWFCAFPRATQSLTIRRRVTTKGKTNMANIFDRDAKRKQRDRAGSAHDAADYDLLKDKVSTLLIACIAIDLV